MDEIKQGHIEEAEMMDLLGKKDCYYANQNQKGKELCPLEVKENTLGRGENKTLVSVVKNSEYIFRPSKKPRYDEDKKEPAETPTSHPILKGRLK